MKLSNLKKTAIIGVVVSMFMIPLKAQTENEKPFVCIDIRNDLNLNVVHNSANKSKNNSNTQTDVPITILKHYLSLQNVNLNATDERILYDTQGNSPLSDVEIYPNPINSGNTLYVSAYNTKTNSNNNHSKTLVSESKTPFDGKYTIELWSDRYGLIKSITVDSPTTELNLVDVLPGIYVVRMIVDDRITSVQQLVVR